MESMNGRNQESENELTSETNSKSNKNKDDNAAVEESTSHLNFPPKCIIKMLLEKAKSEKAKSDEYIIKKDGLLVDPVDLEKVEKSIVSVFVVDKRTHKICCSTKTLLLKR